MVNASRPQPPAIEESAAELGKWFTDYLTSNGYWVENDPASMKQMIVSAFPPINDGELTPENIQPSMLKMIQTMNKHIALQDQNTPFQKLLATGAVTREGVRERKRNSSL